MIFPLAFFLAAGTLAWSEAWIFLLLYYGFVVATARLLSRRNPTLLEERMSIFKPRPGGLDWMFVLLFLISALWLVLMPLDAVRYHWTHIPFWLQVVGAFALAGSFVLIYRVFQENAYLTPTIRIQLEREHKVVSSGPYRFVRHPMYSGACLFLVGTALLLGSVFGLLLSLVISALFARRAVMEENLLRSELPGYEAYMSRVRYRLLPRVW
ncbi:isoprenylcysteine carboxyl methyltransferase [Ktedonospora formicarum]|uniref:Isoprenylcysteine carboxyl methyltransferase n=1 Tax=Ktedonospora formicarum TaxID=2778364 RepID=A0A8J3MW18_9CHLR|nr:isoprenylcysteine carboxyl methyltransferase [Ktedonospora formicarum]